MEETKQVEVNEPVTEQPKIKNPKRIEAGKKGVLARKAKKEIRKVTKEEETKDRRTRYTTTALSARD